MANFTKNDIPDITTLTAGNLHLRFETKTFNKKQYATEGKMFNIATSYIFGTEKEDPGTTSQQNSFYHKRHDYLQLKIDFEQYFKASKWLTIGVTADSYFSNNELFNNYTSTLLASQNFSPTVNSTIRYLPYLRSNNFLAGGLKTIIPITPSTHLRLEGYYFQPFNDLMSGTNNVPYYSDKLFSSNAVLASGGFVVHTPFGPASLLLNYYSASNPKLYLQISFGYLLYNRGNR